MKLRFATYQNRVTSAEVRSYADHFQISIKQAMFELENRAKPILEVFNDDTQEWEPAPHVNVFRD